MKEKHTILYKNIGETPLEALERFRVERIKSAPDSNEAGYWKNVPMTYAGRLDPMAEGKLLILIGEECKNKEKYLSLDKEYEIEIVFGIATDTYDSLGIPQGRPAYFTQVYPAQIQFQNYLGKFIQPYPPYSSKTVDGVQLHELSRRNELPKEMPSKEVEIYEIEMVAGHTFVGLTCEELKARIFYMIDRVHGDFRQEEIKGRWREVLDDGVSGNESFEVMSIRVKCSSGTYMRSLAHRMGQDLGTGAFALSIKRTKIFGLQ